MGLVSRPGLSLVLGLALWLGTGLLSQVWANRLQVGPTLIEMAPARQADAVWLTNSGSAAIAVQVRVFQWDQAGGSEQLTPTSAVMVSPTQTTIQAGQRQLVRILRRGAPSDSEQSFRIIVDELSSTEPEATRASGLQFRLRYSIPVFLAGHGERAENAPRLQVALEMPTNQSKTATLVVQNNGRSRAQLAEASLLLPNGTNLPLSAGLLGYVLPGRTMRWPIRSTGIETVSSVDLKVRVNAGVSPQTLPIRVVLPY